MEIADKLNLVIVLAELMIMSILLYNEIKLFKGRLKNGISLHIFAMAGVAVFDFIFVLMQTFKAGSATIAIIIIHDLLFFICLILLCLGELQVLNYKVKRKWLITILLVVPSIIYIFTLFPYSGVTYPYIIEGGRLKYSAPYWIYIQGISTFLYRFISIGFGLYTYLKYRKDNKQLAELGMIFIIFSLLTLVFSVVVSVGIQIDAEYINQGFFLAIGLVYLISKLNMYEIKETTAKVTAVETELNMATSIQKNMLPINFNDNRSKNKIEIFASMNPAKEVGGDFYDFYWIDDDHLALCIADVSGKGVPAALFMVIAKTIFRNACKVYKNIEDILKNVNEQLCEDNKNSMFVTCWAGILELSTGKLKCANAGHEYPAFCRHDNKFELIKDKHGFPLASVDFAKYTPYELKIKKGDILFVYTDGFPEANNEKGEMLGLDKLIDILNNGKNKNPSSLVSSTKEGIKEFIGKADQFDDLTMLAIKLL